MRLLSAFLLLALVGISCAHPSASSAAPHSPRLVLISIDGLRPDFYTTGKYRKVAPTLARISDAGERAPHGIIPVFPSVTYPDHVSMVTGAYSSQHGIVANQIFSPTEGPTDDWYWYAKDIRVPTLWDKAVAKGLKVALLRWPTSTGAKVDWDLPEIFAKGGFNAEKDWAVIRANAAPTLLQKVLEQGTIRAPKSIADLDSLDTQALEYLLKNQDPDLVLIHLVDLDRAQHQYGTDAPQVTQAAAGIDQDLSRIMKLLDPEKTTVIVTGDHGFASFTRGVHLPALIREAGLEKEVVGQSDGGQAAIYRKPGRAEASEHVNDPCGKMSKVAATHGIKLTPLSREALGKLHSLPDALCALEADIGSAFLHKDAAETVEELKHPRGHHGYLPSRPEMRAGFFIWGRGVMHPGAALRADPSMPDIAPTAAAILGIPFSAPAGTAISF